MRRLVLTIDMRGCQGWQITAMGKQLTDWAKEHKEILGTEDLAIINTAGPTTLYWLDGDIGNPEDAKTLEKIKSKLEPIMKIALDVKVDNGAVERIVNTAVDGKMKEELRLHRANRDAGNTKKRSRLIFPGR